MAVGRVINLLSSWGAFTIVSLWLSILFVLYMWPLNWWLTVTRIAVFDSVVNAEVILQVDQAIHREFVAEWSVLVRKRNNDRWAIVCQAHGTRNYFPEMVLPEPITLEEWTDGRCASLSQEGSYIISTLWTIEDRNGFFPKKTLHTVSNTFTVNPSP
jgi:hypothetical protein